MAGILAVCLMPAAAEQPKVPNPNAPRRLDAVRNAESEAQERIKELEAKEARLKKERARLKVRAIEIARDVQVREAAMTSTEERLRQLMEEENGLLEELKDRQTALSSILAALQLMERNKPPALVVQPNDAVNAARTAMLLGSILPKLQGQADNLGRELEALVSLRQGILDQREQLAEDREALEAERLRLSELIEEKKKLQVAARRKAEKERAKLTQLASQARDLESLVANIDRYERNKPRGKQLASAVPPSAATALRPRSPRGLNQRLEDVKGKLRPPVTGTVVRRFREKDRTGSPSEGVTLRTRPGAQVVAPFNSTIMFAQPYRSYGKLLILSTGDGHHFVLAGMTKIYGVEGQKLLEGEPIGVMGASEEDVQVLDVPRAAGTGDALQANAGPELYFEIRKNGNPVNPLRWLATARLENTSQ
ncbi:MAG: murein hydrolase activator EnvC family protein [Alphaproteobacteria bacterium]